MSAFNWQVLRKKRDQYLKDTDFYMLADVPLDTSTRSKYKEYRQYLRHLPKMYSDESIKAAKVLNYEEWKAWKNSKGEY